ncbi:MAG: hypothetical protein GY846_09335, partial [Deltaproteobacteria bacterium]|nr:hypothetical protein [Deltaproteobacteria bacterium]
YTADAIVNMGHALAKMGGMGAGIEAMMYMIDDRALKFLGIEEGDVKAIMDEVQSSVAQMAGELG